MSKKYYRQQPFISKSSDEGNDYWSQQFQENLNKTSVQSRKMDQSLYDQINSIINTKSKYKSVAEAVKDMQERSGFAAYVDGLNKNSGKTENTKTAAENEKPNTDNIYVDQYGDIWDDHPLDLDKAKAAIDSKNWFLLGKLMGEKDLKDNALVNGAESIRVLKYWKDPKISSVNVPTESWITYTMGYDEGAKLPAEERTKDIAFTKAVLENIYKRMGKKASDNNDAFEKKVDLTPIVIKKMPSIKNTLENYIKSTKGNISIPAIIDKIRSIHQSDISEAKDWDDENLLKLVSKLNLEEKKNHPEVSNYNNLGTQDYGEADIDQANVDFFHSLNPTKY